MTVLSTFLDKWSESLSSKERADLIEPFAGLIPAKESKALAERRRWLVRDWFIRVYTPAWLDLLPETSGFAVELRTLDPIETDADLDSALPILNVAEKEASAAWNAAKNAASSAASSAAWSAAWDAASSAADAAWDAAWDAASSAAGSAASSAAGSAAWRAAWNAAAWNAASSAASNGKDPKAALQPTVEFLQDSAVQLVMRMVKADSSTAIFYTCEKCGREIFGEFCKQHPGTPLIQTRENPGVTAVGDCFRYANTTARRLADEGHKDVVACQGTVKNVTPKAKRPVGERDRYEHAWVEHAGKVWDSQTEVARRAPQSIRDFYATRAPSEVRCYTPDEATGMMLVANHHGPWTPKEDAKAFRWLVKQRAR